MTTDFSSRQMRAFLLVAQHLNFTRAAEALFITPAGLSLLIRQFELQLGFRLFERTTRHVALTAEGAELLPAVHRSLEDLDGAMSRAGERVKHASHTLSIGAGHIVAAHILPQAIKEFRLRRPDVRITVVDDDPTTTMQKVRAGAIDIGVGSFEHRAAGVRHTLFFRFSLMVIRPESDSVPRRASTTWSALKDESLILPSLDSVRSIIEEHLAQAGVSAPPAMVLNRLDTIAAMVEAGQGTGIVPSYAQPACQHRRVVVSRLTNPTVPVDFYQIRNRARKLSPAAEEFTTFLQRYIARWAGRAGLP
jgi:LysR family transcriptional regulator, carnitine catabolism transcriptional activator